jgi:site-specific DNA-methyltransferase (cytosine-N4-specific)
MVVERGRRRRVELLLFHLDAAVGIQGGGCHMILQADAREIPLADESVHCVVTSPPYWGLRDYGEDGQIGLEPTPEEYVDVLVGVFREVRRVLRADGTLWLNLGDCYAGSRGGPQGKTGQMNDRSVAAQRCRVKRIPGSGGQQAGARRDQPSCPPGLKPKDLVGIPWRVALALQADGWWLRSDIVWAKPNPMPESVTDRPTKSHEHVFMLAKRGDHYFDQDAVREPHTMKPQRRRKPHKPRQPDLLMPPQTHSGSQRDEPGVDGHPLGRNIRDVWTVQTQPYPGAHFAVMPPKLVEPCIKAGCPAGGVVLDPFFGAGTVGLVAARLNRRCVGLELSHKYCELARARLARPVQIDLLEATR